jgi:hypothetical protein
MPPVQNIATFGAARPSASQPAFSRANQAGKSLKVRMFGSFAPANVPTATS